MSFQANLLASLNIGINILPYQQPRLKTPDKLDGATCGALSNGHATRQPVSTY